MADERLEFTIKIAQEAGQLAQSMRENPDLLATRQKGHLDLVTAADHAVEDMLRERIKEFDPGAAVLGEETGLIGDSANLWIIDPIDGTFNFSRGMPEWAISIAYCDGSKLSHGVIHAPDLGLTAAAVAGQGAVLNGRAIDLRAAASLNPVVALGYSPRTPLAEYLTRIEKLLDAGIEYRRHGAATIGFLGVLAGWFDAYYEPQLNVWDAAAGLVLIEAAGGIIRHDPLEIFLTKPSEIFAGNGIPLKMDWS